jgi:methylated-DNA-[protein]-cysteine S-methyltransferase
MNLFRSVTSFMTAQGWLVLVAENNAIVKAYFSDQAETEGSPDTVLIEALQQLQEYFSGHRKTFNLDLQPAGTEFQKKVWSELVKISSGKTFTYQKFAESFSDSKSIRAVASAIGANPIALLIPCHRVLGSNGSLTGYAWGIARKEWLLQHEKGVYAPSLFENQESDER